VRAITVMFDTLNRRHLPPYGCDWTHAPHFRRLAERSCTFDSCYVGSMPCMPARRELHTGRYNSWEFVRGQEGDPWIGQVAAPTTPPLLDERRARGGMGRQDWVNRGFMRREADQPQPQTFAAGMDFMRRNAGEQNWSLQIETFDPHEPFFTQEHWQQLYPHGYDGPHFDWPPYGHTSEPPEAIEHMRYQYAALLSMCDHYLGQVIDLMDSLKLWDDTMLIVCTDHGFLLGEHESWAKCWCPFYNEIAHTPLFVWDPRSKVAGERRQSLVQTIDLPATLLEFFGQELPEHMQGRPLRGVIESDEAIRDYALFGIHGGHVNVTDGRHVYMRGPVDADDNGPLFEYTLMPTRMRGPFALEEFAGTELHSGFGFSKGVPLLKVPKGPRWTRADQLPTVLYDVQADPEQADPIDDAAVEERMQRAMVALMRDNEAPPEQYERLGLAALLQGEGVS